LEFTPGLATQGVVARTVFTMYPRRTILCLGLFVGQAFLYNAFYFTYGDTLSSFFNVDQTGYYIAIFALSNFVGALALSPLFDSIGRVKMIASTYIASGVLLAVTGLMLGSLTAVTLTACGVVVFFIASAGASSAYLTASAESEKIEDRLTALARMDEATAMSRLAELDGEIARLPVPFEEWETVYRQRLQVERNLLARRLRRIEPAHREGEPVEPRMQRRFPIVDWVIGLGSAALLAVDIGLLLARRRSPRRD